MSLYRFSLFSVFAIAVTLSSIAKASDGVIHFMGAIVDDACNVTNTESSIQTRCYRNGKVLTQTANQSNHFRNGTTKTNWLEQN